jgi:hypothetical protein
MRRNLKKESSSFFGEIKSDVFSKNSLQLSVPSVEHSISSKIIHSISSSLS